MDAEKSKKLQQYSVSLAEQAREEEKNGKPDEAIKRYLKLVDVFLVLAADAPDHNTWLQYIRQAEAYQTRTRALIPKEEVPGQEGQARRSAEVNVQKIPQRTDIFPSLSNNNILQRSDSTRPTNPLKKILKPFQRTEIEGGERNPTSGIRTSNQVMSGVQRQPNPPIPSQPQLKVGVTTTSSPTAENTVSSEVYQRVLSENRSLRDKLSQVMKEKEEQLSLLERKNAELEEKVLQMVPRADYEVLQSEFENSVPKLEYERVKAELLDCVPKAHYDDLLNRISSMVPRDLYLEAERRSLEFEDRLKNTIPRKVIDDLAGEVSLLGVLSEIPLDSRGVEVKDDDDEEKEQSSIEDA
ncbi:MAG: hypothetical protein ACREBS_08150 [Nitrososphaerales archaeon]